jgi:ribosome-associated toxin RatA of RatAB toxin-antitoxin module
MADSTQATITIDAEPKAIMAALADVASYPSWSSPVERAEVRETGPDGRPAQAFFAINAMITKDEFTVAYDWSGDEKVSWHLVEGKMLKAQNGSYELRPLPGGGTEVHYSLSVELAIKVPGILRKRAENMIADAALKDLKKHLES